jgi:hypothetical protein
MYWIRIIVDSKRHINMFKTYAIVNCQLFGLERLSFYSKWWLSAVNLDNRLNGLVLWLLLYPALTSLDVQSLASSFWLVEFSCHNLFMNTENIWQEILDHLIATIWSWPVPHSEYGLWFNWWERRLSLAVKLAGKKVVIGWWIEEKTEAIFIDAKFIIYDPKFHQKRHFHRDLYLVLIKSFRWTNPSSHWFNLYKFSQ